MASAPVYSRIRARVLETTALSLTEMADRLGIARGDFGLHCAPASNIGPLLDLIAAKLKEVEAILPKNASRSRYWRLSADQIRLIRVSGDKQDALAAEYRVDKSTISRIKTWQAYRWVE